MDKATAYALRDRINLGIQKASDRSLREGIGIVLIDRNIAISIWNDGKVMLDVDFDDGSGIFAHGNYVKAIQDAPFEDDYKMRIEVYNRGSESERDQLVMTYILSSNNHEVLFKD